METETDLLLKILTKNRFPIQLKYAEIFINMIFFWTAAVFEQDTQNTIALL